MFARGVMRKSLLTLLCSSLLFLSGVAAALFAQDSTLREQYNQALFSIGQQRYDEAMARLKRMVERDSSFYPPYLKIVEVAKYQGTSGECERFLRESLATSPNNPFLRHALGLIYLGKKERGLARRQFLRAIQIDSSYYPAYLDLARARRAPKAAEAMMKQLLAAKPDVAAANLGLSYFYSKELDRKKQIEFAGRALRLQPKLLDALYYLAQGYYWSGDLERAKKECAKGIGLAKSRGDLEREIQFLNLNSFILNKLGAVTDAIAQLKTALDLAKKIGGKVEISATYNTLARIHWYLDDFRQAERFAQQALDIDLELGDDDGVASNLGYIGIMNFNLGDYSRGLDYYYRAKDIYKKINNKSGIAICTGNIASGQMKLGDYEKAIAFASQAISSFKELGPAWHKPIANYLRVKGVALRKLERYPEALSNYEQSLKILRQLKTEEHQISSTLTFMGDVYRENGNFERALEYYKRALKTRPLIWKEAVRHETRLSLANLYLVTQQYEQARDAFSKVLEYGLKVDDPELLWKAEAGLASVYRTRNEPEKAIAYFSQAMDHIESIRGHFRTAEEQSDFFMDKFGVYSGLVGVLYAAHQNAPQKGHDRRAFSIAERGKTEILLDFLSRGRIFDSLQEVAPELKQRQSLLEKQLEKKRTDLSSELAKAGDERNPTAIDTLRNSIDHLQQDKVRLFEEIERRYPELYRLLNPRFATVGELQRRQIGENEILVEYLVGEEKTYLWAITRNRFRFRAVAVSKKQLKEMLASISPLFRETKEPTAAIIDHRWANINTSRLRELYELLLGRPAQDMLRKGMRLIIAPDDVLRYFPFEILVTACSDDSVRYLIDDFPVSYTPSASLLKPERLPKKHASQRLLAFANPDPGQDRDRGFLDWVHSLAPSKSILRGERFAPLPFSEAEVEAIAADFSESAIFLQKNATEENFKRLASNYQVIHLATHNIVDDQQPLYSKVVFARSEQGQEDGFLQTYEVFNLNLQADLVALSGCGTGLGKLRRGEGLTGMTRAFMYAGAENLLVSLWPVNDESTAELMTAFYGNMQRGLSKSRALQQAKKKLIHANGWRQNAFYWGAFVLVGND